MMRLASKNGLFVHPKSGHRPPENKTTRKRKQHKRTEVESPNVEEVPGTSSHCLQQQNFNNSGSSLEPTQRPDRATAQQITPASTTVQSNAVPHSNSMTLTQRSCLPTRSHQMEKPPAVIMGRSYHRVSPQDGLRHHPPVMPGGRPVQQHDPRCTGQNCPQPKYASGAESWHSGHSPHRSGSLSEVSVACSKSARTSPS
ncbi:hypothetical protein AWC38_SpisGene24330 [Stylophora pistillata]|uniref:Uncharacterized protein n=1 Tax=Stylophora pistillata TaxID=50429 RepID=A0A2B4R610_STYPI|nr:hypothetical protein AWC38_SpisGene24330 [Stylophora pistillata]